MPSYAKTTTEHFVIAKPGIFLAEQHELEFILR